MKINNYNFDFFKQIDSELKAYILGYIVADGCITIEHRKEKPNTPIKRVQFHSSVNDLQVIGLIRDTIAPTNKLTIVKSKRDNSSDMVKLRIANKIIVQDLMELYGILPRKTYNKEFEFPTRIPNEFRKPFIRGYFDGNGSMGEKHFSFTFNSLKFLNSVLDIMLKEIPTLKHYTYTENRKFTEYYSLHFSVNKKSRLDLFNFLYKGCTYKLDRKYNKSLNTVLNSRSNNLLSV